MDRKYRIIRALEASGKTRQALADKLGLGRAAVSDLLNREGELDSLKYLEATAELTGFNFEWLRSGRGPEMGIESKGELIETRTNPEQGYLSGKYVRPVTVVVNERGREVIPFVTVKAQAGYMKGFGDPEFIEKLPAFSLPIIKEGTYRMFQVDGDSMLQLGGGGLHDGDIVIAQYVEDILSIRDNRVYVIVSTDGIFVKRCLNRLKDQNNPILVCNSDNKNGQHPARILHAHEILEVWELKAFISKQLSFNTDLWQVLTDLQFQQAVMSDKIKDLEKEKKR